MKATAYLLTLLISLTVLSCAPFGHRDTWNEDMQGMTNALRELMPYIYDEQTYALSRNKPLIQARLRDLNHHSRGLDPHIGRGLSGDDPLMQVSLDQLKNRIQRSHGTFLMDNASYSQQLLRSSVNYCIQCHLRTDRGRSFVVYENFGSQRRLNVARLALARAQIAMRELKQARETLLKVIDDSGEKAEDRLQALDLLMMLNVRRQDDFSQATGDLKMALSVEKPFYDPKVLQSWMSYMQSWGQRPLTEIKLQEVLKRVKKEPPQRIHFLRDLHLSRVLHHGLSQTSKKQIRAQILFKLGQIYQHHVSLSSWELPETYFEACMRELPHSQQAERCYTALQDVVVKEHKVSGLSELPQDERRRLLRLKEKSQRGKEAPAQQAIDPEI